MKFMFTLFLLTSLSAFASDNRIASYMYETVGVKTYCLISESSPGKLHFDYTLTTGEEERHETFDIEDYFGVVEMKNKVLNAPYTFEEDQGSIFQTLFIAYDNGKETLVWGHGKRNIESVADEAVHFVQLMGHLCDRFNSEE